MIVAFGKFLSGIAIYVLSGFVFRLVSAIGLGFYIYRGLDSVLRSAFSAMSDYLAYLPTDLLQLMALSKVDIALSLIASAMLSSAIIRMVAGFFGVKSI